MSDDIIYVDSYDFDVRIEHGITVVLFFDEWCVQSMGIIPFLEEIADEYYDTLRVLALDIEQSPDVASVFAIDVTPTVIIFKDGKIVHPVREMLITGNIVDLWSRLLAAGSDARRCRAKLTPTLAFDAVDFSG